MSWLCLSCVHFFHLVTHLQGGSHLSLVWLAFLSFGTIMVVHEMSFDRADHLLLCRNGISLYTSHSQWYFVFFLSGKPTEKFPNTLHLKISRKRKFSDTLWPEFIILQLISGKISNIVTNLNWIFISLPLALLHISLFLLPYSFLLFSFPLILSLPLSLLYLLSLSLSLIPQCLSRQNDLF